MDKQMRTSPTDLDLPPVKPQLTFEFDLEKPWPERYLGQKFGPSLINKALKAGFYVLCELPEIPERWAVSDARWMDEVLEVLTLQGWRPPTRIWTVTTLKGLEL